VFTAAALSALALLIVGIMGLTVNGTARAASGSDVVAPRGDLLVPASCIGQTWPDISADCLIGEDGAAVSNVRTVTIGYQTADDTSVLLRLPAPQLAAN
jgi:hypothetical protein